MEAKGTKRKAEEISSQLPDFSGEEIMDKHGLKKLVLGLEKSVNKNLEDRIKFREQPEKFMESEIDLAEDIQKMHAIATAPELYPDFVRLGAVVSVLNLLTHENTDISVEAVDLVKELTEPDNFIESEEALVLIDALLENNLVDLLCGALSRLDPELEDEAQGLHNALNVLENLVEIDPKHADRIGACSSLLDFIFANIDHAAFHFTAIKLYCAEIFAIVLQNSESARAKAIEQDAVTKTMDSLADYVAREPENAEEVEFMENLGDALIALLTVPSVKKEFEEKHFTTIFNIIKNRGSHGRHVGMKLLDHILLNSERNCAVAVENGGLRMIFPVLMKLSLGNHKKGPSADDLELAEHTVSSISSLLRTLQENSMNEAARARVLAKFSENGYEKIFKISEIFSFFADKVDRLERRGMGPDDTEESFYLRKLEEGLYTLQHAAFILASAITQESLSAAAMAEIRKKVQSALQNFGRSLSNLRSVLQDYLSNIGEGEESEQNTLLKDSLQALLRRLPA